jgi:hypothetical protein
MLLNFKIHTVALVSIFFLSACGSSGSSTQVNNNDIAKFAIDNGLTGTYQYTFDACEYATENSHTEEFSRYTIEGDQLTKVVNFTGDCIASFMYKITRLTSSEMNASFQSMTHVSGTCPRIENLPDVTYRYLKIGRVLKLTELSIPPACHAYIKQ